MTKYGYKYCDSKRVRKSNAVPVAVVMGQVRVYNDLAMIRMITNTIYYSSCSAVQGSTLVEVMVIVGWQLLFIIIIIISKNSNLGGPSRSSFFP